MRSILALAAGACFVVSAAAAQTSSQSAASGSLSLEQATRISQLIMKQTAPLVNPSFSIAVDSVVPSDIPLYSLPSDAEQLAPQLRGFRYIVVEELVAIVEPRTRRIEIVFPRWGGG